MTGKTLGALSNSVAVRGRALLQAQFAHIPGMLVLISSRAGGRNRYNSILVRILLCCTYL